MDNFDTKYGKLDQRTCEELNDHRKYRYNSVCDLLRVIRNKAHHWRSLPEELSELMGPMPDGFVRYFTERYPALVISVYRVLERHCDKKSGLGQYFTFDE